MLLSEASSLCDAEDIENSDLNQTIKSLKKLVSADIASSSLNNIIDVIESENDAFEVDENIDDDYYDSDDLEDEW